MTTLSTKMTIGYKFEMTGNGFIKLVCAKGRMIEISSSNDMYNVKGYSIKGVDEVKVKEVAGVFGGEQLQNAIVSVF